MSRVESAEMVVAILGGGQLGRMLALAGYPLGAHFRFLEPNVNAPLSPLATQVVGAYDDPTALEELAQGADVVTYEFENVPVAAAKQLAHMVPIYPPPEALRVSQDRWTEKTFLRELGIATARFERVDTRGELTAAVERIGLPAVLKTRRMGYDGKGQFRLSTAADIDEAWGELGGNALILEEWVFFRRELSMLAVRGRDGELGFYPLVENVHAAGILRSSVAPAPNAEALQGQAEAYARRVLEGLEYVGVLAIEFFEVNGTLCANEMAPRVHNSGHWTIEGAETSQFENHLRAILGLPLGAATARGYSGMMNLLGTLPDLNALYKLEGAHVHLYDKAPRPGRKLGHVTLVTADEPTRTARFAEMQTMIPAQ